MHSYVCYCLRSTTTSKTYVGVTNNLVRRLRQHNGELKGGARYTSSGGPWVLTMIVGPFGTYQHALHFEWHWKHAAPKKLTGLKGRQIKLQQLVTHKVQWPLLFYSAVQYELDLPAHIVAVNDRDHVIYPAAAVSG